MSENSKNLFFTFPESRFYANSHFFLAIEPRFQHVQRDNAAEVSKKRKLKSYSEDISVQELSLKEKDVIQMHVFVSLCVLYFNWY